MADGYMGKILKVDLTNETFEELPTENYKEWGGGHGMGSALFWEFCEDVNVTGDDPKNVVTIMTSPLSGTIAPSVAGRCEVQGIGLQGWPKNWFTRTNFGGRFSAHIKFAGWDGIVLTGKAKRKVWLNIINGKVSLEPADELWSLNTREVQEEIWAIVDSKFSEEYGSGWQALNGNRDAGRTTQKAAVLATGAYAENYGPCASLIHDAGSGAGQGGFGGVFAHKNLKAVSVLGTGGVEINDPQALLESRLWAYDYTHAGHETGANKWVGYGSMSSPPGMIIDMYEAGQKSRPWGCLACIRTCRGRNEEGKGNESGCVEFAWYTTPDTKKHGQITNASAMACSLIQEEGVNAYIVSPALQWLTALYEKGIVGPGKEIDSNLPWDRLGEYEFAEAFVHAIITQTDIGKDLALGTAECATKWGRYEEDTKTGVLPMREWGYPVHYDARMETEWGYGSLLAERDCNNHDFNWYLWWTPTTVKVLGETPPLTAEETANLFAKKLPPYSDPMMIDYSDEGIYSEAMAKLVAWHRHYSRFWKDSCLYCDWAWADFINPYREDYEGLTVVGEPRFFKDVTGVDLSFEEGMEKGRRIWNLDRAIWILQGRHRDQEVFTEFHYEVPAPPGIDVTTVYEDGEWKFKSVAGRVIDREKFEEWKTKFFKLEGWDPSTGWPLRETLEELDLKHVADRLEENGKLGQSA